MARGENLTDLTRRLVAATPVRAKSLIVTVFGDSIAPHGGTVWLGSLIRLVDPLGLNERLVRTSVLRLSRDDWLRSTPIGRRSYYRLTESGHRRFESAHRRIYARPEADWDGSWTCALLGLAGMEAAARDKLRRELTWLGFGSLAPNCMIHPSADADAVRHVLQDGGGGDHAVMMTAVAWPDQSPERAHDLVRQCWDLDQLSDGYRDFLDRFRPLLRALQGAGPFDPQSCFIVRTLLIHEFRRVLLRDPELPRELLPEDWAGIAARRLCRDLYRLTQDPAEAHIMAVLETADGPLPEAAPYFYRRFEEPEEDEAERRSA